MYLTFAISQKEKTNMKLRAKFRIYLKGKKIIYIHTIITLQRLLYACRFLF